MAIHRLRSSSTVDKILPTIYTIPALLYFPLIITPLILARIAGRRHLDSHTKNQALPEDMKADQHPQETIQDIEGDGGTHVLVGMGYAALEHHKGEDDEAGDEKDYGEEDKEAISDGGGPGTSPTDILEQFRHLQEGVNRIMAHHHQVTDRDEINRIGAGDQYQCGHMVDHHL